VKLSFEEENRGTGSKRSNKLECQDQQCLLWLLRYLLDGEERYDRYLHRHEELPEMGSRSLIGLMDHAEESNVT
jgi:hypothetical protein